MSGLQCSNEAPRKLVMSRRSFVAALGASLCGACLASGLSPEEAVAAVLDRKIILYDSSKCVGCHICEAACRKANELSGSVTFDLGRLTGKLELTPKDPIVDDRDASMWLKVIRAQVPADNGFTNDIYVRHSCTHCGLCADVCPSGAVTQRPDGIVTMDADKCIGCHYCYQACPFDVPRYRTDADGGDHAMQKCTMCASRVDEGKVPACVEICPKEALSFGSIGDMVEGGAETVAALVAKGYDEPSMYGDTELGGTGLVQILPYGVANYDLPAISGEVRPRTAVSDFGLPLGVGGGLAALAAVAFGGYQYMKNKQESASGEGAQAAAVATQGTPSLGVSPSEQQQAAAASVEELAKPEGKAE